MIINKTGKYYNQREFHQNEKENQAVLYHWELHFKERTDRSETVILHRESY